jgi:hypothetical protein
MFFEKLLYKFVLTLYNDEVLAGFDKAGFYQTYGYKLWTYFAYFGNPLIIAGFNQFTRNYVFIFFGWIFMGVR